jgi:hypothetical protein
MGSGEGVMGTQWAILVVFVREVVLVIGVGIVQVAGHESS